MTQRRDGSLVHRKNRDCEKAFNRDEGDEGDVKNKPRLGLDLSLLSPSSQRCPVRSLHFAV